MDAPAAQAQKAASASSSPAAKRLPVKQMRVGDVSASIVAREFNKYVKCFDVDD